MCLENNRYNNRRERERKRERERERESKRPPHYWRICSLALSFSRCKAWRVKFLSSNTILRFGNIMIVNSNLGNNNFGRSGYYIN